MFVILLILGMIFLYGMLVLAANDYDASFIPPLFVFGVALIFISGATVGHKTTQESLFKEYRDSKLGSTKVYKKWLIDSPVTKDK